jgi:hypothetical protein
MTIIPYSVPFYHYTANFRQISYPHEGSKTYVKYFPLIMLESRLKMVELGLNM